jgi:signal transduction histidine kinase
MLEEPMMPDGQLAFSHPSDPAFPFSQSLREQFEQQKALAGVISRIRASLDLQTIFKTTATEVRQLLNADRVGMFCFAPDSGWNEGEFVSEDVVSDFPSAIAAKVHDHCFGNQFAAHYEKGRVQAVADIYNAELSDCHIQILKAFQVRANLIVPLLQGTSLWGLLCIHHCRAPRQWQSSEIEFVKQIADHLGIALQQAEYLQKVQTQSKELEQALQDLQHSQMQLIQHEKIASLGQLVAGVAHEINNPVNFIHGNLNHVNGYVHAVLEALSLYQRHYPQPALDIQHQAADIDLEFILEDLPKTLSSMELGSDRIRQIVLSLRSFSRLDEAEFKAVNIHDGLDSALLILGHRLKKDKNQCEIEIIRTYGDIPLMECYPAQLNQVFMNLLSNAIDAIEEAGATRRSEGGQLQGGQADQPPSIWISTQLIDPDRVELRIRDSGIGISTEDQAKIFEHFFTTKLVGKRTGLGLAIAQQIIVDKHQGTLVVNSAPGEGAEFVICLPIKAAKCP